MQWVEVRGFRSIRRARVDLALWANFLMGLNDHGKSNFLRAIHLFFTGRVEPGVAFDLDRDFCTALRGRGHGQRITVDVGISPDLVHPKLLSSIKRKMIFASEEVAVRRIWRRGGVQTALVVSRGDRSKVYAIPEDGNARTGGNERGLPAHAPRQFATELERLLGRFRVHYLPSNKAAASLDVTGLSQQVKHYLFDPYARSSHFAELANTLEVLRERFRAVVKEKLDPHLTGALQRQFVGVKSTDFTLPDIPEDIVRTGEIAIARDAGWVPLSACGSGLQSLLMLEVLAFLDKSTVVRAHELEPRFVWLIEEPEAFLYEDLIHHVGARLEEIGKSPSFTVLSTSHSRELVLATMSDVHWARLTGDGTRVVQSFDLFEEKQRAGFRDFARSQFGSGLLESELMELVKRLGEEAGDHYILVVEGKHDQSVVQKLLEVHSDDTTPAITVIAPVTGSQNAQHVTQTVLTLSDLPRARVVGLYDNDVEGVRRFRGLEQKLRTSGKRNAAGLLLPATEHTKAVSEGHLTPGSDNRPCAQPTGQTVSLAGHSLTLEALYDDAAIARELRTAGLVFDHWVPRQVDDRVVYRNLVHEGGKKRAADIVVKHLRPGSCGSLKVLFDEIVSTFQGLVPEKD